MKPLQVAKDIVPLAEFKAQSASWLERVRASGQPVIINQNGKPAAAGDGAPAKPCAPLPMQKLACYFSKAEPSCALNPIHSSCLKRTTKA